MVFDISIVNVSYMMSTYCIIRNGTPDIKVGHLESHICNNIVLNFKNLCKKLLNFTYAWNFAKLRDQDPPWVG